jgi:hypothetical protein
MTMDTFSAKASRIKSTVFLKTEPTPQSWHTAKQVQGKPTLYLAINYPLKKASFII